jgi:2-polyprenyl-3-methyl-5-hydroxy-6-metoxy-1,4-benzoquinol methylase
MDLVEQQRKHFDNIADIYYSARQNKNHLRYKKLLWQKFFKDFEWNKKETFVLEPMCGYSEGKDILSQNLKTKILYEGFDYSQPLINEVHKKNPEINIYKQDITKFKPKKKYDIIIIIGGLHHVYRHTSSVLSTLNDALKKNGYLIVFEPTQNNLIFRIFRNIIYSKNKIFDSETERAYDLKTLNNYFESNGLEIVKQMYPGLLGYILYYNPDAFPFLNKGNTKLVNLIFRLENFFYTNFIGKYFSFATMSLLKKKV